MWTEKSYTKEFYNIGRSICGPPKRRDDEREGMGAIAKKAAQKFVKDLFYLSGDISALIIIDEQLSGFYFSTEQWLFLPN